jgi:hypothetical protein
LKHLLILSVLFWSASAFAQNGYIKQTIVEEDTTTLHQTGQIFWKLKQDVDDYILESKLTINGEKIDIKYPVISREYNGFIKEYVVKKSDVENFTIRFNSENHSVTYIYAQKKVVHKGRHIKFDL